MKRNFIIVMVAVLVLSLTACGNTGSDESTTENETTADTVSSEKFDIDVDFSDFDLDDSWDESTASKIKLNGDSISFSGEGATVSESTITINSGGTYAISGTLDDGQIIVDTTEKVQLVLNGAEINCSDSSSIYVKSADKTVITLAKGTSNSVTDGSSYVYDDEANEEPNAAIFSKDDLTFNGSGSLTVNANFNNGITGKDDLKIVNGTISVTAVNNGITGKDSLLVKDGDITVNAGGDGIRTNNDTESQQGYIYIGAGTFNIVSGEDGIQADTCMLIADGDINIQSGGGSSVSSSDNQSDWGNWGNKGGMNNADTSTTESNEASAKGIKAGVDLTIENADMTVDSSDDSIHTNGTLAIEDGNYTISSGDDGIHADTALTIDNGEFVISKSYEGIESSSITINDGSINVTSSDDGLNAGGGADSSAMGGRPGENNFTQSDSSDIMINVNGGTLVVNSNGDGLDSNGNINMTGGNVIVYGPTNDGNGALDYQNSFKLTGGSIGAAGALGMAQAISDTSSQYCISIGFSSTQPANTTITIKDESGKEIYTITPVKTFASLVVSIPDLESGKTYSIYANGTLVDSCTISDIVTTVGSTAGNMGGGQFKR